MASLEAMLRTQALAFPGLTALLGTNPFRWYDTQLRQGTAFPAVTVQLVSGNETYAFNGRLATGWSRMQFTIWDSDPERARNVEAQLTAFLDVFNGTGIQGLSEYPNSIVMRRQTLFSETQPPLFQRINDAQIFSNSTL